MRFQKRLICLLLALGCIAGAVSGAVAAEVDCDAVYCFTDQDFSTAEDPLTGICITELPDAQTGTVLLGHRVLQEGDILTAQQVAQMTFAPLRTQQDTQACVSYLPIYEDRVENSATMTIAIRGKEDKAPVAEDSAIETYKNLPNEGQLKVTDPEGQALTYTLVRSAKRGDVTIREDGSFVYTPRKNKVGVDSFTFTAADPAGNVSREATVTVQILKPTDARQYTDTMGLECRFEAEWLRNSGLFVGENVSGQACFNPEKTVSKGEFLAMLVNALDIPTQDAELSAMDENVPQWLRPYLAAALRSGLIEGLPAEESGSFAYDQPITGAQTAVMLQNALDLSAAEQTAQTEENEVPAWAVSSMNVMQHNGISLSANDALTRADCAQVLYQVSQLAITAPGTAVFRMQE